MQNRYPLWKYILLGIILIIGIIYAIPNLYSEDPAVQVSAAKTDASINNEVRTQIADVLKQAGIVYKSLQGSSEELVLRFNNTDEQLKAQDIIKAALGSGYTVALNLIPSTPQWLTMIGAAPMKQGLDLRGGVHFLLQVDINSVMKRHLEGMLKNIGQTLRGADIRYTNLTVDKNNALIRFPNEESLNSAYILLQRHFTDWHFTKAFKNHFVLKASLPSSERNTIRQTTLEQTMTILRNRVNELGVGEAVVQQQGASRVAVDLPGIQDAARAKQILGGTATLEFHLVDAEHDPQIAEKTGAPIGSKLYLMDGQPILLKRQVVLSGDSITSAMSSFDQQTGSPSVSIQLGGGGENLFSRVTRTNIGKRMAILFVETKTESRLVDGKIVLSKRKEERVISAPVIQSALGNSFQITGLSNVNEARNLALLLRAGALPTTIYTVEEKTVGPTLGKENIRRGLVSLEVGMGIILIIMAIYYRLFGLIANIALFFNLVLLVALLSIIDATLTLPGIAGIVLTIGMAVDANVLIYERIREELRHGSSIQVSIHAGYERAFSTIVDANATTFIVAIILFAIGTGPIKGFAVTLSMGLLTSMLTGIYLTRAIVNLIYGKRSVKKLSIGI